MSLVKIILKSLLLASFAGAHAKTYHMQTLDPLAGFVSSISNIDDYNIKLVAENVETLKGR